MILAHRIQLDPTPAQREYFARACGVARFTWNWALAEWGRRYAAGEKPNAANLKKAWNSLKHKQFPWVAETHKDANQQPFTDLQVAFINFFKKRARYPNFKKRGVHDTFYVSNDKMRLDGEAVVLPKLGRVRMTEALRFPGKILSARVSRDADRWFIAVQVDTEQRPKVAQQRRDVIGVDLGLTTLAVLSTGEKIEGPKALKKNLERLRRLSRSHSRKQRGSSNRRKAVMRLARLHRHIRNIRSDFMHKVTTKLCRENQAVIIEDLNVQGIGNLKNTRRSVADAGMRELRRQLEYKSVLFGTRLVVADRWFPSTKTCRSCGVVGPKLDLKTRVWTCSTCGAEHDRDVNAAKNLEQLGWVTPEVTPVDKLALALSNQGETGLVEAGISHLPTCG